MSMFTQQQVAKMYEQYKELNSLQKLADMYYCCSPTISRYFKKYGYEVNPECYHPRINPSMVMHDWNAGININKIVETYGFASTESAYVMIKKWRKQGYEFNRRSKR
jgi:hypothetical protein